MLALLYDIHGNLPALEAVLADAGDVEGFVLGGDYAVAGAWPRETVERLKELENATWIRGNVDRWAGDPAGIGFPGIAHDGAEDSTSAGICSTGRIHR